MEELQKKLGYTFKNPSLLEQALTHCSRSPLQSINNERLEFLGDSLLCYAVTLYLFKRYPALSEGALSRIRAAVTGQRALEVVAEKLSLSKHVLHSPFPRKKTAESAMYADAVEAIYAAMLLDGGMSAALSLIIRLTEDLIAQGDVSLEKDAKTLLQEFLQARQMELPRYDVAAESRAPEWLFTMRCHVAGFGISAYGKGKSKKAAEAEAAQNALRMLDGRKQQKPASVENSSSGDPE